MSGGYSRELVERLMPTLWDEEYAVSGIRNPYSPDPDMPKGHVDKKKGSSLYAHLADIKSAWTRADVPLPERQALLLRFGLDWEFQEIGAVLGVSRRASGQRVERGIGRLTAWLNGDEYVEGYAEDPSFDADEDV